MKNKTIKITFDGKYVGKCDIIVCLPNQYIVESEPIKTDTILMKIGRFITFGFCFKPYWSYNIRKIDKNKLI